MSKLKKLGKGIVLMHDFQAATADAAPELLAQLKAGGYKIVQSRAKGACRPSPPMTRADEGHQAADGERPSDLERRPHDQRIARL